MSPRRRHALALALSLTTALAVWGGTLVWRSRALYDHATLPRRGWHGRAHTAHPELGYAPLPGATALHTFPVGEPVSMRYDASGFRVPVSPSGQPGARPIVLALGCSFTYGDACRAEDTFTQRVAEGLGGTARNAGVCGWGLAQMLLRAREALPTERPDIVLVQDSPWLLNRSLKPFGQSRFARTTAPYFVDADSGRVGGEGGVALQPPAFETTAYDLPMHAFFGAERSVAGFGSFVLRVGAPLFAHDDLGSLAYRMRRTLGLTPPPTARRGACLDAAYGEIAALCRASGARMVVVRVGLDPDWRPTYTPPAFEEALLVDGQAALVAAIEEPTRTCWDQAFGHWRGEPPQLVDRHLNPHGHAVLAEAILASLRADGEVR